MFNNLLKQFLSLVGITGVCSNLFQNPYHSCFEQKKITELKLHGNYTIKKFEIKPNAYMADLILASRCVLGLF